MNNLKKVYISTGYFKNLNGTQMIKNLVQMVFFS